MVWLFDIVLMIVSGFAVKDRKLVMLSYLYSIKLLMYQDSHKCA